MDMPEDENRTEDGPEPSQGAAARPAWAVTMLASVLIFTTVVDVLGNLLVIVSVLRNRKLRNAGNVFVVSLAFADLVVAFYPYPLVLYAIFHDGWSLGDTNCKTVKEMVAKKYEEEGERVKMEVQQAVAITCGRILTTKLAGKPTTSRQTPLLKSRGTRQKQTSIDPRIL